MLYLPVDFRNLQICLIHKPPQFRTVLLKPPYGLIGADLRILHKLVNKRGIPTFFCIKKPLVFRRKAAAV